MQGGQIDGCREEPALAGVVVRGAGRPPEVAVAGEYDQKLEAFSVAGELTAFGEFKPLHGEVTARAKKLCIVMRWAESERWHLASARKTKVSDFECFFDMQLSRLTMRIDAAVVVNAIGEVGIFLHFADDHVGAYRVRRSGGYEKSVARMNVMRMEKFLKRMGGQTLQKSFLGDALFEPSQQFRARLRGDDVPHFGLAAAAGGFFVNGRVRVIGVDLDRKLVLREDKFCEKGKIPLSAQSRAAPISRHFVPCGTEASSRKRTAG